MPSHALLPLLTTTCPPPHTHILSQGKDNFSSTSYIQVRSGLVHRLLGLPKDASFEEVQSARNYLFEQYRWHEPSRESIELAFEAILKVEYGMSMLL